MVTAIRPHLLVTGGAIAIASAQGIGRFVYTPILPAMIEGVPITEAEAGLIASANYIGYLLGGFAASSPRMPGQPHTWMLSTLALSALTTGAMFLADTVPLLILLRFLGGAASAFVFVLTATILIQRLIPAGRSDLTGTHFVGVGAGIALSALVTWAVITLNGDWRLMWLAAGGVSLLAFLAVLALIPPAADATSAAPTPAANHQSRGIWSLIIAYTLFGFGYVITATFIITIVRGTAELRALEPFVWLVVGLAAIPSIAFWTWLARKFGVLQIFALACVVEAIGVILSVATNTAPMLFLAAACLGGTFVGITAIGLAAGQKLAGGNPRHIYARMTAAFGIGQVIGPVAAGYGFDITGSFFLPSMAAAAALCLAAALAWQLRTRA